MNLRVALVGNMANVAYTRCKALRKHTDVEADVFVNEAEFDNPITNPDLDSEYHGEKVPWVKPILAPVSWFVPFGRRTIANHELRKTLQDYDLIESYCLQPSNVDELGVPYISFATGSDLREMAFVPTRLGKRANRVFCSANLVLYHDEISILNAIEKLGLTRVKPYRHIVDPDFYKPNDSPQSKVLTIFHPTRLDWEIKGNDRLFKSFREFLNNGGNGQIVYVEHGNGYDLERTRKLIETLEINRFCSPIKGPLDRETLLKLYQQCDIVVDQFTYGAGLISLEAMSVGKPVLTYPDTSESPPPVCGCATEPEIVRALFMLENSETRQQIGEQGRSFILKYHSPKIIANEMKQNYENVLSEACLP